MDDATLIAQIAAGDADAIAAFHARWFGQFYSLAMKLTKDSHESEDIAQNALVRVISNAGKFDKSRPARTWLLAIVYHLIQDWARARKFARPPVRASPRIGTTVRKPSTFPTANQPPKSGCWHASDRPWWRRRWRGSRPTIAK